MADAPRDATTLPPRTIAYDGEAPATDQLLPDHAGRIALQGELARGGMGAVLRGHDPALRRDVAVKILLPSHAARPDLVRRFVEEAQVAGQLQHPGVVPVYDLGAFADGRPYFAMKLVQGRTLAQLLAERPNPAHDLSRFLKIFEAVCQAVAFAHSHRIIHRDLKPLNIMVGAFGEVQVMDWGIAKVLGAANEDVPTGKREAVSTAGSADSSLTAAGSTLGTLAYMPPEQAAGEPVDERADVFGLGSVLCEILTGQPPYVGSQEVVLWHSLNGDLAEAHRRLGECSAGAELIALARRCLAAKRDERPGNAAEVAAAVGQYLSSVQERLQQAMIERAAAEAKAAEERKRRQTQLTLAGVVLAALLGAGGIGFWIYRDRATQRADANQRVDAAVQKARLLESQGQPKAAFETARQARELANDPRVDSELRNGVVGMSDMLSLAAEKAENDQLLMERLQDASDIAESGIAPVVGNAQMRRIYLGYHYEFIFRDWGADLKMRNPAELLPEMHSRPLPVRKQMAASLDQWALVVRLSAMPDWPVEYRRRITALAAGVDPDREPIHDELRMLHDRNGGAANAPPLIDRLHSLAERANPLATKPETLVLLALELQAAGDSERALDVLRGAARVRPGEVLLHERLAHLLLEMNPPRRGEAIDQLRIARALRPRLAARLAMVLVESGQLDEAMSLCRAAELSRPDPEVPYMRAGEVLLNRGRANQAMTFLEAARHRAPKSRPVCFQVATAYEQLGRFSKAESEYRAIPNLPPVTTPQGKPSASLDRLNESLIANSRQGVARCRQAATLESRLPAILSGKEKAPIRDRLALARISLNRTNWNDAVALYATAFAEDPALLTPVNSLRYNAACAAVLAATAVEGRDTDDSEKLRRQALAWLQGELAALKQLLDAGQPARVAEAVRLLRHWQTDEDLNAVRGEAELRRYPSAERDQWIALWAEVDASLKNR